MKKSLLLICGMGLFLVSCSSSKTEEQAGAEPMTEETKPNDKRCDLRPDAGDCNAAFPKFYFDQTEKKCKEFIWGGCDGAVPFNTIEECEKCGCQ